MINFQFSIKGSAPIKKNNMGELWYKTIKDPRSGAVKKIPLGVPVRYYKTAYKDWAKSAAGSLAVWKNNWQLMKENNTLPEGYPTSLPITTPLVISCHFYINHNRKVDISNLVQGTHDLLIGSAGNFLGTKAKPFDHNLYKIIHDDNKDYMKNLGSTVVFFDKGNPRTDIFITEFSLRKWGQIHSILHPGLAPNTLGSDEPKLAFDNNPYGDLL